MLETTTLSLLVLLLVLAVFFDVGTKHIPNWLTLGTPFLFLVIAFASGGWSLFIDRLLAGFFLGWLWGIPWMLGMIGGGDQKLLAAVGTAVGVSLALPVTLAVAVVGGAQALVVVGLGWFRGDGKTLSFRERLRVTTLPYSLSIALGTVVALVGRSNNWW